MKWQSAWLLVMTLMVGCSTNPVGTEAAARNFFQTEFQKWIAGESSDVATRQSQRLLLAPPISYDIRSIVRDEPDFFACQETEKLPSNWQTWPAFKRNVTIEWKAEDSSLTRQRRLVICKTVVSVLAVFRVTFSSNHWHSLTLSANKTGQAAMTQSLAVCHVWRS
ncbi:hypothetical protein [Planctopirus limnophila]|nr:hypothetical protein [Planctopirus limnophila]